MIMGSVCSLAASHSPNHRTLSDPLADFADPDVYTPDLDLVLAAHPRFSTAAHNTHTRTTHARVHTFLPRLAQNSRLARSTEYVHSQALTNKNKKSM